MISASNTCKILNRKTVLIPNMVLKVLYGFDLKRLSILIFKIKKFKSDFPRGKQLKNLLADKASPPLRNVVLFSKKWYQKTMISKSKS